MAYHTDSKYQLLDVEKELIRNHSVVSTEVAVAMAHGVKNKFNTTHAIATTGNAGPAKGDSEADLGTVCIAIVTPDNTFVEEFRFGRNRERVIQKAVNKSFEILYKSIG